MPKAYRIDERFARCVIASDIHCRDPSRCEAFLTAARVAIELGGGVLIVLGDLFDELHRKMSPSEVETYLKKLVTPLQGLRRLIYVTSGASHDPIVDCEFSCCIAGTHVNVYPPSLISVEVSGLRLYCTHGDLAVGNGAVAYIINRLAAALSKPLYVERLAKARLGIPPEAWFLMGHTHIPGVDYQSRVANPGSWREAWLSGVPYWRRPSRTALLVADGKVELIREVAIRGKQYLKRA